MIKMYVLIKRQIIKKLGTAFKMASRDKNSHG
jgi:hypothetical protein